MSPLKDSASHTLRERIAMKLAQQNWERERGDVADLPLEDYWDQLTTAQRQEYLNDADEIIYSFENWPTTSTRSGTGR